MVLMGKTRSNGFDALKGIACILVVFVHCNFPGVFGVYFRCLARWTVPMFFTISGFYFRKEDCKYALNKAKHVLIIFMGATAYYIIFEIILHIFQGDLLSYTLSEFSALKIASCIVFGKPFFIAAQMWFLQTLVYSYLAYAFIIKVNLTRYEKPLCVLLLVGHFAVSYGGYFLGFSLKAGLYRNWILEGLPFLLLGKWLYESGVEWFYKRWNGAVCGFLFVGLGVISSIVERTLLGRDFSVHLGSIAIVIGLIIIVAGNYFENAPNCLVVLGRDFSTLIYIIHPSLMLIAGALEEVMENKGIMIADLYQWLKPPVIMVISLVLSVFVKALWGNIKPIFLRRMEKK